ncbi:hypothetical protein HanIR_Chr08g0352611 [Helianthus annuus]|nr:hypothetical protein HanIR_Chr08g0352611 [Helianthus annuus]
MYDFGFFQAIRYGDGPAKEDGARRGGRHGVGSGDGGGAHLEDRPERRKRDVGDGDGAQDGGAARCWLRRRTATHRGRPPYRMASGLALAPGSVSRLKSYTLLIGSALKIETGYAIPRYWSTEYPVLAFY